MTDKKVIKEAAKTVKWTQATLAEKCGFASQASLGSRLTETRGKSMTMDLFVRLLDAMGYEVVVQSKNPRANQNRWVIDMIPEKKEGNNQ